jgi:hypothetical protein
MSETYIWEISNRLGALWSIYTLDVLLFNCILQHFALFNFIVLLQI